MDSSKNNLKDVAPELQDNALFAEWLADFVTHLALPHADQCLVQSDAPRELDHHSVAPLLQR